MSLATLTDPSNPAEAQASPEAATLEAFTDADRCLRVAGVLSMLANPTRLKVLCMLSERDWSVDEIVGTTGSSFSALSQQLKLLTLAGMLDRRKEGRNVFYRLKDGKVLSILHLLRELYTN